MTRLDHQSVQDLFSSYLEGDLVGEIRADLEVHLGECDSCRDEFALFRHTVSLLGEVELESPPAGLAEAVGERLRKKKRPGWLRRLIPRPVIRIPVEVVAVGAVALFAVTIVKKISVPEGGLFDSKREATREVVALNKELRKDRAVLEDRDEEASSGFYDYGAEREAAKEGKLGDRVASLPSSRSAADALEESGSIAANIGAERAGEDAPLGFDARLKSAPSVPAKTEAESGKKADKDAVVLKRARKQSAPAAGSDVYKNYIEQKDYFSGTPEGQESLRSQIQVANTKALGGDAAQAGSLVRLGAVLPPDDPSSDLLAIDLRRLAEGEEEAFVAALAELSETEQKNVVALLVRALPVRKARRSVINQYQTLQGQKASQPLQARAISNVLKGLESSPAAEAPPPIETSKPAR